MNAKLLDALTGQETPGRRFEQAVRILSAIRGPDDDRGKVEFTAPIRRWVFTSKEYGSAGFSPTYTLSSPLATEKEWLALRRRVKEAYRPIDRDISLHYGIHIRQAIDAIIELEGWTIPEDELGG